MKVCDLAQLGHGSRVLFFGTIAGTVQGVPLWGKKTKISSWLDKFLLVCSTPIPILLSIMAFKTS